MFDSRWDELSLPEKLVVGSTTLLCESGLIFLVVCLSWILA